MKRRFLIFTVLLFLFHLEVLSQEEVEGRSEKYDKQFSLKGSEIVNASKSVNLVNGSVSYPLNLISLAGKNGLDVGLSLNYSSSGIEQNVSTWNADAPTSVVGLGWTMEVPKIIVNNKQTGAIEDDEYFLIEGNKTLQLIRTGIISGSQKKVYEVKSAANWKVIYDLSLEKWEVQKEDGTKFCYGDKNSTRNTVQWIVKWGNWIGASSRTHDDYGVAVQQQQAYVWNLSEIKNIWNDAIYFTYENEEQHVGRSTGKKHTESSYLKKISDVFGRTVVLYYGNKISDEYVEPHTEQAEPDAYQEVYEKKFLDRIEVYNNSGDKLLSSVSCQYMFIDNGDGTQKLTKRLLTGVTRKNSDGDVMSSASYGYILSGANKGKLETITTESGGKIVYTYSEGLAINHSKRDLIINAPAGFAEPEALYGENYAVITWRKLNASGNYTTDPSEVRIMCYTWEGEWVLQDLGSIYNVKTSHRVVGNTLQWIIREDFFSTAQNDFFAFMNPTSNENYKVCLFRRNMGERGKWTREDYEIRMGNYGEKPSLRSGDHFISVHAKRLGTISTFVLANDRWLRKDLDAAYGQPYGEYYNTMGNNYIISHNEDGAPDNINFFYLDEQRQWQRRILPNTVLFYSNDPSNWYGSNAFALVMAQGSPEFIYQWDENYNNFTRKDILGSHHDFSKIYFNNELVNIKDDISDGALNTKIKTARFDGYKWHVLPDIVVAKRLVLGTDLRTLSTINTGEAHFFNPNLLTWQGTGDGGFKKYPYIGASHLYSEDEFYYRYPNGQWELKGRWSRGAQFYTGWIMGLYGRSDSIIIGYPLNGHLNKISIPKVVTGCFIREEDNAGYRNTFIIGNDDRTVPNMFGPLLFNSKKLALHRLVDNAVTGLQTDRPVRQIKVFDGQNYSYTAYSYDVSTASKEPSGITTYYNKVTTYPGMSLAQLEGQITPVERFGYTEHYFFNGLLSSQSSVPFSIQGPADRYKYLLGSEYETRVYNNSSNTLVSRTRITWNVADYTINHSYGYADSKYRGLPVQTISMVDGVETTTNSSYNSLGQVSLVSVSNHNSLNQEEIVQTQYRYGHEVSQALRDQNILSAIVSEKKVVSGSVTDVQVTTWTNWGNDRYAPYKTFAWTGSGSSDFDFSLYNNSSLEPPAASWKKTSAILSRNDRGDILCAEDAEGIKTSSFYNKFYLPVLQVKNADISRVFAENYDFGEVSTPGSQSAYLSSSYWKAAYSVLKWEIPDMSGYVSLLANPGNNEFNADFRMRILPGANINWIGFRFNKVNATDDVAGTTLVLRPDGRIEVQDASGQVLAFANLSMSSSRWHYFRVVRRAGSADIYVDGTLLLANVNTGTASGNYVGFVANKCMGAFDDLRVYPPDGVASSTGYDKDFLRARSVTDEHGVISYTLFDSWGRPVAKTRGDGVSESYTYHLSANNNNGQWNAGDPDLVSHSSVSGKPGVWEDFLTSDNTWTKTDRDNGAYVYFGTSTDGKLSVRSAGGATNWLSDSYSFRLSQALTGKVCVEMDLQYNGGATDWNFGIAFGGNSWDGSNGGSDLAVYTSFNGAAQWNTYSEEIWKPIGATAVEKRWFRVKIVADFNIQKADYYVDGRLLLQDVPFRMPCSSVNRLSLFHYGFGNPDVWYVKNLVAYSDPVQAVEYYAADGKVIQTQKELPNNEVLVSETLYDPLGRESVVTRPTKVPGKLGYRENFVTGLSQNQMYGDVSTYNPEDNNWPFSRTIYEASPSGRALSSSLPGADFNLSASIPDQSIKNSPVVSFGSNAAFTGAGGNYTAGNYYVIKQTDADGNISYTMKDKAGNVIREKAGNIVHAYEYDKGGNVVKVYQPNYFTPPSADASADTSYHETENNGPQYNGPSSGPELVLNQSGMTGEYTSEGSIRLAPGFSTGGSFRAYISGYTPAESYVRTITYDHWGNLLTENSADNGTARYLYDKANRVRFSQDANGASGSLSISYMIYDRLGRITEEGYLPGATWNETTLNGYLTNSPYSSSGYPSNRIWRKRYSYGSTPASLYDWNRLLTVEVNNNTDAAAEVTETYSYDREGNVTRKGVKAAGESQFSYIDYEYNNQGQVTRTNYNVSGFSPVEHSYDAAGRLAKVSSGTTTYASYTYNKNGDLAAESLNNASLTRTYQYNSPGWLTQIDDPYFSQSLSYTSGGAGGTGYYSGLIAATGITYKNSSSWPTPPSSYTVVYRYDQYGRLLTADNSINSYDLGTGDTIRYDANGNILFFNQNNTAKNYSYYSGTNRLKSTTGNSTEQFAYDASGNVTRSDPRQISSISYDPYLSLTTQISTANSVTSFQYGADDQRVLKRNIAGGITRNTYYIHGGNDYPLIEKGDETKLYIYGLNGLIAIRQNNQTEYLLKDHLGSTRVVVAGTGSVLAHYDYNAYGSLMRSTNPNQVNYEYTGQEQDDETGLQNYRARMYDGETGIFYAVDPVNQTPSGYSYAGNNPVLNVDPDGRFFHILGGALIGGIANVAIHWGKINDWKDGLAAFGIGAAAGGAAAATAGASLAVGGAAVTLGETIAAGVVTGMATGYVTSQIEAAGNSWYFGDTYSAQSVLMSTITGGVLGGVGGSVSHWLSPKVKAVAEEIIPTKYAEKPIEGAAKKIKMLDDIAAKGGTNLLGPGLKFSNNKLIQHAHQWGIAEKGAAVTTEQLSAMKSLANHIYKNATTIRQGTWGNPAAGGFKNALFYSNGKHIIVTQSNGSMITILRNATGNKHFNNAVTIWTK